jgi:hypothetical protein
MRMNAANGIGPVAYNYYYSMYLSMGDVGNCTVIASESCFARGVDHCLASEDDHLKTAEEPLYFPFNTLRAQVRA